MKRSAAAFASILAVALAGCIELEEEFTLNPDGSGKVVIGWVHSPINIFGGDKDPEAAAKSALKDELEKSEGVEAWTDVSCTVRDDGKLGFKGTAYFKDLSKVRIYAAGFKSDFVRLSATKDAKGNLVLAAMPEEKAGDKPPGKKLSDEELKKKIRTERAQYQQAKPFVESMLKEMRFRAKINLPGKLDTATNFKRVSDSAVQLVLEGQKLLKMMDELIMDDEWFGKQLQEGGDLKEGPKIDESLNEKIYGEKGPVRASTTGALSAAFDFQAEVAAAQKAYPDLLAKLGVRAPSGPPAKGGDFKSLKVCGVRFVYSADSDRGVMPLGRHAPGLTISLMGELPGRVLNMKEGRVEKASTDAGEDLLPRDEWQRKIHFPQLTSDKSAVCFDVELKLPGEGAKGLREVAGVLTYVVGEKTKDVDVGLNEFKAGSKGMAHGATITELEDSTWQEGHQSLQLKLDLARDMIESVVFQDEAGATLAVTSGGGFDTGETSTLTFTLKGKFPAKGRVVVRVYDDLKTYEIPFAVRDVDLLGKPLK